MKTDVSTAAAVEIEAPERAGSKETTLVGTGNMILGLGVMHATGRDGHTTGWVLSVLARRPSGKCKYTALEEVVSGLPKAYSRVWNRYTQLFRTEPDALRAISDASTDLNMPILRREAELISRGLPPKVDKGGKTAATSPFERVVKVFERVKGDADKTQLVAKLIDYLGLDLCMVIDGMSDPDKAVPRLAAYLRHYAEYAETAAAENG